MLVIRDSANLDMVKVLYYRKISLYDSTKIFGYLGVRELGWARIQILTIT